jgi:hypothetical protein
VGAGLQVMQTLMEESVTALAGPKRQAQFRRLPGLAPTVRCSGNIVHSWMAFPVGRS